MCVSDSMIVLLKVPKDRGYFIPNQSYNINFPLLKVEKVTFYYSRTAIRPHPR